MPPTEQRLEVIDEARLSPATDLAIRQLLCECFPAEREDFARRRAWHDSVPAYTVVARRADRITAHLAVVLRAVACAGGSVTVAGVQSFCVAAPFRGTGLSGRLMAQALHEARRRGIGFGMLFCLPELAGVYRAWGWSPTDRPVAMLDEHGKSAPLPEKNICMLIELGEQRFPSGPLDLQGRDW